MVADALVPGNHSKGLALNLPPFLVFAGCSLFEELLRGPLNEWLTICGAPPFDGNRTLSMASRTQLSALPLMGGLDPR